MSIASTLRDRPAFFTCPSCGGWHNEDTHDPEWCVTQEAIEAQRAAEDQAVEAFLERRRGL